MSTPVKQEELDDQLGAAQLAERSHHVPRVRKFLDCVLIQPYHTAGEHKPLQIVQKPAEQNDKKPVVIKKKSVKSSELKADTVRALLDSIGEQFPVNVDNSILHKLVRRDYFSDKFGGNLQKTYPEIKQEDYDRHGYKHFCFPNLFVVNTLRSIHTY